MGNEGFFGGYELDSAAERRPFSRSFSNFHVMRPTFRPHRLKRVRKIGFRARMSTRGGRAVITARRKKGRARLSVA